MASVSYKKQDGLLALSKDQKSLIWKPTKAGSASNTAEIVTISVGDITNLQQTPVSSPKVMLKVFSQDNGKPPPPPKTSVFTFTSEINPRNEADAIKEALTSAIQAFQAKTTTEEADVLWENDDALLSDAKLHQSLMHENPALRKLFTEMLSLKPATKSMTDFTAQFWSSRIRDLRVHAVSQKQEKGRYNVFSELKREDGGRKMNLTSDHVRVIFEQYPIVQKAHDEIVPNRIKEEAEFWSRFFQSQLFMALRGLKFDKTRDARDPILDRYLDDLDLTLQEGEPNQMHLPKFFDLAGNEENHSQRKGNRPDVELRESALNKAPIIRRLNALSENIVMKKRVVPAEDNYDQLQLQDLTEPAPKKRKILQVKQNSQVQSMVPPEVDPMALKTVYENLIATFPDPGAHPVPIDNFESSDAEDDGEEEGTLNGAVIAYRDILKLINDQRNRGELGPSSSALPPALYDRLVLVHRTTYELQRQFWASLLSGESNAETKSIFGSLQQSLERIEAIATEAEKERQTVIKAEETKAREHFRKFGRKIRIDHTATAGGDVVREYSLALVRSVNTAIERYHEEFPSDHAV